MIIGGNDSLHGGHSQIHTDRYMNKSMHSKFITTSTHLRGFRSPGVVGTPSVIGGSGNHNLTQHNPLLSQSNSVNNNQGGQQQSSMIEKERRAIEKIKQRQRKDIEQMMEYELQLERIRKENEHKMIK